MDQPPADEESKPGSKDIPFPYKDNFCKHCSLISLPSLTAEFASPPSFWRALELENAIPGMSSKYGMRHMDNAKDVHETAKTCAMCFLVLVAFTQRYKYTRPFAEKPIFLGPLWTTGTATPKTPNPVDDQTPLKGMLIWVPIDGHPPIEGNLDIIERGGYAPCILLFFTDDESPHTFQRIVGRCPVRHDTGSPQTLSRLRHYFTTCRGNHPKCLETVAGPPFGKDEEPILPTRIIDLGHPGSNGEPEPRLIYAEKSRGNYVALSYRSPHNTEPFCTTSKSIGDHLQGIPWDNCPKLFRDAMKMTKDLGMRYIWIDLLCIVQDDRDEWLSESRKTGKVFERATLVIADSMAWSFDEGLFNSRGMLRYSPSSTLARIPYHDASGVSDGTMLYVDYDISYSPWGPRNDDPNETYSSFQGRAWVTQEFLMARRVAFFMLSGFVWSCRSIRIRPNGVQDASTRNLHDIKWSEIVQQHVLAELKQPEDQLLSLEGLRTEIQKRYGGIPYKYGVFEKELQLQLMWRVDRGQAERHKNPKIVGR
ncbi:hypothetical protein TrVFT333_006212 [Trichoderma virens FT-333]|nr:hypothetical protein TrVFT333_006212 [Trichoderma virens FT-333]